MCQRRISSPVPVLLINSHFEFWNNHVQVGNGTQATHNVKLENLSVGPLVGTSPFAILLTSTASNATLIGISAPSTSGQNYVLLDNRYPDGVDKEITFPTTVLGFYAYGSGGTAWGGESAHPNCLNGPVFLCPAFITTDFDQQAGTNYSKWQLPSGVSTLF